MLLIRPVASLRDDCQLTVRHPIVEVLGIFDRRKIVLVPADGDRRGLDMSDSTHTVEGVVADPVLIRHLRIGPCRQLADRIDERLGRAFGEAQTRIDGNPGFTRSQLAGVLKDVRVHPQPRARINEHHAGETVRIIDGRGQGDPAAERMSGDHKPVPAQMIGQPDSIMGVIRGATKPAAGRLAVPRQVYRHRRMTVGHRPHMPVPHPAVTAGTVDI